MHCCASSTVVLPNGTVSVLFKSLYTVPETKCCCYVIELCPNSCNMHKKQSSPDTKDWFVQNVHNSISCTLLGNIVPSFSSCTIVLRFVSWQKENQKRLKYGLFSLLYEPVCRIRPTKIRISVSQLYPKLCILHKKGRFLDTPVQHVQNVHRFTSCAIGRHVTLLQTAWKRRTWWKAQFRFYLRLSAQRTTNQQMLLRHPTGSKITHYQQITKFPWTTCATSRMCTAVPRGL